MTISIITILNQTIEIDNVDAVIVTAPVDDATGTGTFVRAIRIFGEPSGINGTAILEIHVKSTTASNIELTTPALNF